MRNVYIKTNVLHVSLIINHLSYIFTSDIVDTHGKLSTTMLRIFDFIDTFRVSKR